MAIAQWTIGDTHCECSTKLLSFSTDLGPATGGEVDIVRGEDIVGQVFDGVQVHHSCTT